MKCKKCIYDVILEGKKEYIELKVTLQSPSFDLGGTVNTTSNQGLMVGSASCTASVGGHPTVMNICYFALKKFLFLHLNQTIIKTNTLFFHYIYNLYSVSASVTVD